MILALNNVSKSFGSTQILENISFHIENNEKTAVTGVNGAGKSTLFKIITGEISHDEGEVVMPKEAKMGYFSQTLEIDSEKTIYEELLTVFEPLMEKEARLRRLENDMALAKGDEYDKIMSEYSDLSRKFEEEHGYEYQSRIRGVIKGLGFSEEERNQPIHELSGGQKTRVALGKLLLAEPDLLLLDEPTNHLDIEMIQWLEGYLNNYSGSVIIISHDRYFLDKVVGKIIEIENRKAKIYFGNYTQYIQKKAVDREIEYRHYIKNQREIKHEEEVIKKLKEFNREKSIKRAESREKMLKKMDKIDSPENLPGKIHFEIVPERESGYDVLSAENLSMGFDGQMLFENISFDIKKGEKAALIGPNGIGKTTLFRIILDRLKPLSGTVKTGAGVIIGYYDQEQSDLSPNKTIFDEISDAYPTLNNTKIRNVLAAFVFTGDDVFKTIDTLSGGEKGRVALAKIMLSNANFLILDEPTNHLDTNSKEILENVLRDYKGTVLYISHDRYFINNTAEKVIELTSGGAVTYLGNYDYYIEKKEYEKALETQTEEPRKTMTDAKLSRQKQKEAQAIQRRKENAVKKIEAEIEETESKIAELDEILNDESFAADVPKLHKAYSQKEELEEKLTQLYDDWEKASSEAESKKD